MVMWSRKSWLLSFCPCSKRSLCSSIGSGRDMLLLTQFQFDVSRSPPDPLAQYRCCRTAALTCPLSVPTIERYLRPEFHLSFARLPNDRHPFRKASPNLLARPTTDERNAPTPLLL